jgi:hypothetical protein
MQDMTQKLEIDVDNMQIFRVGVWAVRRSSRELEIAREGYKYRLVIIIYS